MKSTAELKSLPLVPISAFKSNPAHYLETGGLVTTHGHVRAAFVPVDDDDAAGPALDVVKAQLKLLTRMRRPEDVTAELRDLRASRNREEDGAPR
ncbi:MAG TPA: hypothetical protein VGN33_04305 [Leifsonia sp.]|nr:hypothetical protein [Leifsonia sp.]